VWFRAPYIPKCKVCGKPYAENKVTDGTSSDWPYCEKCADAKCDELNGNQPTGDSNG